MRFMIQVRTYISTILSIVILVVSLLPALHILDHEVTSKSDTSLTHQLSKTSLDCELCDFRIVQADIPSIYVYEVLSPQKETVNSISLAETVSLHSNPLFSLRAPPAVIS